MNRFIAAFLAFFLGLGGLADAARVKDLTNIRGVRGNQLIGFGLVIGLTGTGDSATNVFYAIQAIVNMLARLGVTVPAAQVAQLKFKNLATVVVTADLPAFAKQGDKLDVMVSSLGDAKSLQGGTLLLTPLKGPDGEVYALAQGAVSIGGFDVQGGGRGQQKNHLTVGRIANAANVEKEIPGNFNAKDEVILSLVKTDFTTAERITKAINSELKDEIATTVDGRTVKVSVPPFYKENTSTFITKIESLKVDPDSVAKVIIDERTGTVVMGENVRISTVAISHGGLFVQIKETAAAPAAPGGKAPAPARNRVAAEEGQDRLLVLQEGVALGEIVNGLNAIGVTPKDLISILQTIKAAGALHAELEII